MDLRPTELQELIRSSADEYLAREMPFSRAREIENSGEPDPAFWRDIVRLGWTGLPIAEAYGGQGASLLDLGVVIERLCRYAVLSPYQQTMLAALVLQREGESALRDALLTRVARDGTTIAVAHIEGAGGLGATPETVCTPGGALSGEKRFVEYARSADYHLVSAVRAGVPGLALVAAAQPGVRIVRDLASIGKTPQCVVAYDDARCEGWIEGAAAVGCLEHLGSALASLEAYSYAQKALDMTVEYAQLRVQFGRPIGTFQAVQLRSADMATQVQACRFLVLELLWNIEHGVIDPTQAAVVKAATARAVSHVTQEAHVLHGGIGYITEYDLYFNTIRGKEAALRFGGMREALGTVADALLS
jgi:alkylation response protein AidB-like acyl-CoA dehydrogenase